MSGIVGVINLDGAPIDRELLQRMVESMTYRGPDARGIWIDGHAGFGHTMLRTTFESQTENQPCSLDGQVWITADARVDDRARLIQELQAKGRRDLTNANDVELILHAYHVWDEDCVQHLIGDFSFAIWDQKLQRLFCARDHFGVKPLCYARIANCLVVSNTLNCVRLHPKISDKLNELALADFLLVGYNPDPATSAFADIQRVPPAHYLTCSGAGVRLHRYWTLPADGQIRYKRGRDYVDHCRELVRSAVRDRLRTERVCVWMSGGMDSTSITATAFELLSKECEAFDLRAFTEVWESLLPDDERLYARMVAESLAIPIHYQVLDGYLPFERWDQPQFRMPEPSERGILAFQVDELRHIASRARIVLSGLGGDPALMGEAIPSLVGRMPLRHLAADVARLVLVYRQPPPFGIRPRINRWFRRTPQGPPYPTWLNKAWAARLDLPARWDQLTSEPACGHRLRPHAHAGLAHSYWPYLFESYDPGVTLFPVEPRYPFFDQRLVNYLLAVPPIPWCRDKTILREAMRGVLPEPVRLRPKTPLRGDPILASLTQPGAQQIDQFVPASELPAYVDMDAIPPLAGESDYLRLWVNVRILALNYWLNSRSVLNEVYRNALEGRSSGPLHVWNYLTQNAKGEMS